MISRSPLRGHASPAFLLLVLLLLFGSGIQAQRTDKGLTQLVSYMEGSFTSTQQAAADTNYYDISLHMSRIWPERKDGIWLYVEQAVTSMAERPYRQRVYQVTRRDDGKYESAVFTLKDEKAMVGAWKNPGPAFTKLSPSDLDARQGCAVVLQKKGKIFSGSTVGNECLSNLRGATYATSKVTISKNGIDSWDQGFDASGKQVWGATLGPYKFRR